MFKRLLLALLALWIIPTQAAVVIPTFGVDSAGVNRNVYLYDQSLPGFVVQGSLNTTTHTYTPNAISSLPWGGTSTGSANTQFVAASGFSLNDGAPAAFIAGFTDTGPTTLNINGTGAVSVVNDTTNGPIPFAGGEITAGNLVFVVYSSSGAKYHLVNPVAASSGGAAGFFSPLTYGAVCNGVTDDTTAIQAAETAAQAAKGVLLLPGGTCATTSCINVTGRITIQGSGASTIQPAVAVSGICINTIGSVLFQNFIIKYASVANNGTCGICMTASGGENLNSRFSGVYIVNAYDGMNADNAASWIFEDGVLSGFKHAGLVAADSFAIDHGDYTITRNQFFGINTSTGTGIIHTNGGMRAFGNKFNTMQACYSLNLVSGGITSIALMENNSCENFGVVGFQFLRAGATGTFYHVVVTGNEFLGGSGSTFGVYSDDANGVWLRSVIISNNTYFSFSSGTFTANSLGNVQGFNVTMNIITSGGATTKKTNLAGTTDQGIVGGNIGIGTAASTISSTNTQVMECLTNTACPE